jgi:plastocyanin
MPRAPFAVIATFGLLFGGIAGPAAIAQDATPAGEVIPAAECQVEPRAAEAVMQLIATPQAGGEATPNPDEAGQPMGEAADEATVQAVTATYRELVACVNASDFLRVYALYTDDYLRRALGDQQIDVSQLAATPAADEEGGTALVGVSDVRRLEMDRVAARVETFDPAVGGPTVIDAVLVQEGDRYRIQDETVVDVEAEGTPEAADAAGGGGGEAAAAEVASHDIYFEPEEIAIPADTDATVTLPNEGVALHNFSIDALDISVDIAPGATEEITINAPAGEYEFYCNIPGHESAGMKGTMTVE